MSDEMIVVDPKICGGKPTIKGTRIMVKPASEKLTVSPFRFRPRAHFARS